MNGNINNQIVIVDNTKQNELNTILALGLGLFTIKSDGHLWVELPMGISNPFTINNEGHLIVTIPEDASNDYEINTNGVYLYSNLGAVINKLKELSYFDIDIKEIPLRIDDIEKTYYKVNISAAPDKKLSQREIDILVRSLCPGDK